MMDKPKTCKFCRAGVEVGTGSHFKCGSPTNMPQGQGNVRGRQTWACKRIEGLLRKHLRYGGCRLPGVFK